MSEAAPSTQSASPRRFDDQHDDHHLVEFVQAAKLQRTHFLRVARRIAEHSEDAEDIVQHAMLKAFRNLSGFRGDSQMKTWLSAIVLNTAREFVRNQHRNLFVPLDISFPAGESEELDVPDRALNPEQRYQERETERRVSAVTRGLDHTNRRIFEMCVFEEMPYLQVAATLHISVATVKSRMFRSRRDVRMAMADRVGLR